MMKEKSEVDKTLNKFEVSFKDAFMKTQLVIIPAKIQGKEFYFIVDTGATLSSISEELLKYIECNSSESEFTFEGINNSVLEASMEVELLLDINDFIFKETFAILDLKSTFESLKESLEAPIMGLLGSEFLYKYCLTVDFDTLKIYK